MYVHPDITAILIGDLNNPIIRRTHEILTSRNIVCRICPQIYSVIGLLAGQNDPSTFLIIGDLHSMAAENMAIFNYSTKHALHFVCILPVKGLNTARAAAAFKTGAYCIWQAEQITQVLDDLLVIERGENADKKPAKGPAFSKRMGFITDKFFLTSDEQNALLNKETDG